MPPRPEPADPSFVDLPGPRAVDDGPLVINPATGAPGAPGPAPAAVVGAGVQASVGADIGPGYEAEPTAIDPEETTSTLGREEPVPGDAPPEAPAEAAPDGRGRRVAIVVGGLMGGCLLVAVSVVVAAVGAWWWARSGGSPPSLLGPDPADAVEELAALEPDEANPEPDPANPQPDQPADAPLAAPAAAALVFESLAPDTRKLNVRCTGGDGKGDTRAEVGLAAADRCMVTAIMDDRSRLVAVVEQAEAGAYACFAEGEETCQRR